MVKLFLLLFPLLLFSSWEFTKEVDHIKLYKNQDKNFKFVQYKAITIMPYALEKISTSIADHHTYTSWLSDCVGSDRYGADIYLLMQPPWPLSQRQVWARLSKRDYKNKTIIRLISLKHKQSSHHGIWFNHLYAKFVLEALSKNETKVTLTLLADPGGYLPSWMVNLMAWKIPYQSLNDLNVYLSTRY